jgi:hypothetical protein
MTHYMRNVIEELIRKGPGTSREYGEKYIVHWATNAGDHIGRPTLSLSSNDGKIAYKEIEQWAKALKKQWKRPCKILSEINIPTTTTYRNGETVTWHVSRLIVYEKEEGANGTTQLYLF